MKNFARQLRADDLSAVVFLLSHGENGSIQGMDNKPVQTKTMLRHLDNQNCPNMQNKPKMVFTQACRGGTFYTFIFLYKYTNCGILHLQLQMC